MTLVCFPRSNPHLRQGQIASLQIGLGIRAATEQVEVREATQGVDRERTQTSQVIDPRQIADLPISDRDFIAGAARQIQLSLKVTF
jgi:hypothetical protein